MEKIRKYQEFIENNKESLQLLAQKIKSIDTVQGVSTVKEFQGRQYAIKIISEWLTELWGITTEELPIPEEEDEIFRVIEKNV
jgi:hypothetical protein